MSAYSGLSIVTSSGSGSSTVKIIKPTNTGLHQAYSNIYVRVMASSGGSYAWFGPYTLSVGCYSGSVTYADAGSLVTNHPLSVGAATANAYTFANPTYSRSWCTPQTNEIVQTDGTAWAGTVRLTGSGA